MPSPAFRLPKATRELPKGATNPADAEEFISQAAVSTPKPAPARPDRRRTVPRKPVTTRIREDLLERFDAIAERTRISKVLLFEECMEDFIKKYDG